MPAMKNLKKIITLTGHHHQVASLNVNLNNQANRSVQAIRTLKSSPAKSITVSLSRKQSTTRTSFAATQMQPIERQQSALADYPDEAINELDQQDSEDHLNDNNKELQQQINSIGKQIEAHKFVNRHIGPKEFEINDMLNILGYSSLDELIDETVPKEIRLNRQLNLPEALSEHELLERLKELGRLNEATEWKTFIGLGYYDCVTPPAILRNMFENPGWTTAYTAYQAEIAQGRLESLMNYQTMISDLTGLDMANASLLDESTAAAEAMQVCLRVDVKLRRNKFLLSSNCHPQTRAVVQTRAKALGVQVDYFDELQDDLNHFENLNEYCGAFIQYPNTNGHLFDLDKITKPCHSVDCLVVVATDLMACTLFKPPGDFSEPADLAVGSSQRFGVPLNYGGPHAAFLACRQKLIRSIPGRVVGLTRDSNGNQAYRFALQTREQHIRRDKATSNICTAQALLANMSAMYAVYHGPKGLRDIANSIHLKTTLLAHLIKQEQAQDFELINDDSYFDTLTLRIGDKKRQTELRQRAEDAKINLRYSQPDNDDKDSGGLVSISLDETTKLVDVFRLASLFSSPRDSPKRKDQFETSTKSHVKLASPIDKGLAYLKRQSAYLTHPTFNSYHSEAQLIRYMKRLENKDISLTHSMIPLGSCTMKLNATSQMIASSWPEFSNCHPFQPIDQCQGYVKLMNELNDQLCEITGYDSISFQPNSGAQGEYAGLRVIKSYLESIGQYHRNVCLIPISAHGTNPASAQMAGFRIQTIKVCDNGNIDLDDLQEQIEKCKQELACLMITYPSTFGVFEENIRQICDLVHEAGGQVYLDGANMNAQVGLCRPGDYGSDVSHLNLHKTFCIPHGGGGPGAGPIGVKRHLIPFLPSHPLVGGNTLARSDSGNDGASSFGTVSASMFGSPAILPISWSYIRTMAANLKKSSQVAILNANYMRKRLENHYKILFRGSKGNVAHEFILDCRPFKKTANIEAVDIAKRLQDFGLHAPTVSWPVSNTLMIEPTESEDKQQLDNYCEALLKIRQEISDIESGRSDRENNPIKLAPHTQQTVCSTLWSRPYSREQAAYPASFVTPINKIWPTVGRVDDTYGDINLFCSCPPADA